MRYLSYLLPIVISLPMLAMAADQPVLEPLPEPPQDALGIDSNPDEPQVTIIKRGENTIEEYRINGELYMQKVTPPRGVPYYLVKKNVNGGWARMDGPVDNIAIPSWVLLRF